MLSMRDRVLCIFKKQKPDMVPWFGDLDYWNTYLNRSGNIPDKYKGNGMYQMYRDLGVGFYLQGYYPYKCVYDGIKVKEDNNGKLRITTVETPVGVVREVWKYLEESYTWGPQEHFVKDYNDLKVIRYWYENTHYEPDYKLAEDRYELIGDNGLVMCYLPKSPLMEIVALLAGIETATYAMMDARDEFEETMAVIGKNADEAAETALKSPTECLMIPENLSSEVIGKSMFELYMRNYEEKWNKKIKEAGKFSFVHMDGTMKGLISEVSSTGFTVLEALTPSPVGDISIDEIHKWVDKESVIWGGIPGVFFTDSVSDEDFDAFVIQVLNVMKSEPRYVLGVADQVPPKVRFERVKRVSELVEQYGRYK